MAFPEIHVESGQFPSGFFCCGPTYAFLGCVRNKSWIGWCSQTLNIYLGVSKNRGTPKSSILIGFSIINHPFWGYPCFLETPIFTCIYHKTLTIHVGFPENIVRVFLGIPEVLSFDPWSHHRLVLSLGCTQHHLALSFQGFHGLINGGIFPRHPGPPPEKIFGPPKPT